MNIISMLQEAAVTEPKPGNSAIQDELAILRYLNPH